VTVASFVGETLLETTWGRMSIADLHRLAVERDRAVVDARAAIGAAEDTGRRELAAYSIELDRALTAGEIDAEQYDALSKDAVEQAVAYVDACRQQWAEQTEGRLPELVVVDVGSGKAGTAPLVVLKMSTTDELADVVVDGVALRCGAAVFVDADGEPLAVENVTSFRAPVQVQVYAVGVEEGRAVCVANDTEGPAVLVLAPPE
jgi:hypothetical protein